MKKDSKRVNILRLVKTKKVILEKWLIDWSWLKNQFAQFYSLSRYGALSVCIGLGINLHNQIYYHNMVVSQIAYVHRFVINMHRAIGATLSWGNS